MYLEPAIIFDMDGVLWSTSKYHKLAYEKALSSFFNNDFLIDYSLVAGMSTSDGLKILLDSYSLNDNELSLIKCEKQRCFLEMEVMRDDYNWTLINFILDHHSHINFILATSASLQSCNKFLSASNLSNSFRKVVTSNDVLKSKPDPHIYSIAVEGFDITNSIVIEDSLAGIIAAENAGISNVLVLRQYSHKPQIRLTNFNKEFKNSEEIIKCLRDHFSF